MSDLQVALKLVREELKTLGMAPERPLHIEDVPVVTGTATELEKGETVEKTSSEIILVEVDPVNLCVVLLLLLW